MNPSNFVSLLQNQNHGRRLCICTLFPAASLLCVAFILGSSYIAEDYKQGWLRWGFQKSIQDQDVGPKIGTCENQCRPPGSESLPRGIVSKTSNLERRPLWGLPKKVNSTNNLFTAAVGIKQKNMVDELVRKFSSSGFVVMLFHYDGIVDEWKEFEWSNSVIHVSAINQTKWWFSKRFLHPDIVADYNYIFLWDEDLGVENFNPKRYLAIVKREGLEISQPALDSKKSELHHQITVRGRRSTVHRRTYRPGDNNTRCDEKSTKPPCTGWIEVMAPVFSKAAWRCVWHMIQNDLIHAWGLDIQLGYCAQGDRMKNIGVVDAEYIVHLGIPTLGSKSKAKVTAESNVSELNHLASLEKKEPLKSGSINFRVQVRRQSYNEFKVFRRRWIKAAEEDKCWVDPYPGPMNGIY